MELNAIPSLSEALTKFMAAKKNSKGGPADHAELGRFVAWCELNAIPSLSEALTKFMAAKKNSKGGPAGGRGLYWKSPHQRWRIMRTTSVWEELRPFKG